MAFTTDQIPLFRKVIFPWYDTDVVCILNILFLMFILAFSLAGISVAYETPDTERHVWVPGILFVLSATGILSTAYRLFRRHAHRLKKDLP